MFRKPKSPETIATKYGWVNPKTGELLVSIRGLPNPVEDFVLGRPYVETSIVEPSSDNVKKSLEVVEETVEVEQKEVKKVSSRRRK